MENYGIQTQERVKALRVIMMLNPDLKLSEIAKAAGVYPSNLSNVLNGKAGKLMAANHVEKVFAVTNMDDSMVKMLAMGFDMVNGFVALKVSTL